MAASVSAQREQTTTSPFAGSNGLGDPDCLGRLYSEYGPRLQRTIRSFAGADHLVDDVVQETFIRYYQTGHRELAGREPWPWLLTVSRRVAIDMHRRRSARREWAAEHNRLERSSVELSQLLGDPESLVVPSGQAMHVAEALRHLDPRQRRILLGKHVHGFKYSEIADAEGLSLEALKSALARARRSFKDSYLAVVRSRGVEAIFGPILIPLARRIRTLRNRVLASPWVQGAMNAPISAASVVDSLAAAIVLGAAMVGGMAAGASPASSAPVVNEAPAVTSDVADSTASPPVGGDGQVDAPATSLLGEGSADTSAPGSDDRLANEPASGSNVDFDGDAPDPQHMNVDSDDVIPVENPPAGGEGTTGIDDGGVGAILDVSVNEDDDPDHETNIGVVVAAPCPPPEERGEVTAATCPILEVEEPPGSDTVDQPLPEPPSAT